MCKYIYLSRRSLRKIGAVLVLLILLATSFETVLAASSSRESSTGVTSTLSSHQAITSNYHLLASMHGQGLALNSMVGPGGSATSQLLYLSYVYTGGTLDLVTVDPNTGQVRVYPSPVGSEQGAWGMTIGPDNNMYLGTLPNAHLLQFNTGLHRLVDLGTVPVDPASSTQQSYIWQMTVSPHNHNVYACTYPSADLVSYDPLASNPSMVNLGTMDTTNQEQYIRFCVADPNPESPYIYMGLGSVSNTIVAYNIDTHSIAFRLIGSDAGFGLVYPGTDNRIHGVIFSGGVNHFYILSNGNYTPVHSTLVLNVAPTNVLKNGSTITVRATTITISYTNRSQIYPYTYAGKNIQIFHVGFGRDGKLYGGTALPYDLFTFDPDQPANGIRTLGQIGGGEPYALLGYNQRLYMAAYGAPPTEIYNPSHPFQTITDPATSPFLQWPFPTNLQHINPSLNPAIIAPGKIDFGIRPESMISTPDLHLYIGAIATYGQLSGPLIAWDTQNNHIHEYFPFRKQGVASLTLSTTRCQNDSRSYCLIGGTTISGGDGTTPATSSAQLFSWDTTRNRVIRRYAIPDVHNPSMITDLVTDQASGYVYGIAISSAGDSIFAFNPTSGTFVNGGKLLPFGFAGSVYNSATISNGKFWGMAPQGVFSVDLNAGSIGQATLFQSSSTITAGFAVSGNTLYFGSNSDLWSFTMP